jgi:hypothetical protein
MGLEVRIESLSFGHECWKAHRPAEGLSYDPAAVTRPRKPGKISQWWWNGGEWVPKASGGPVEPIAAGYWSPHPPWRWDGRQWIYASGEDTSALVDFPDASSFTPVYLCVSRS